MRPSARSIPVRLLLGPGMLIHNLLILLLFRDCFLEGGLPRARKIQ